MINLYLMHDHPDDLPKSNTTVMRELAWGTLDEMDPNDIQQARWVLSNISSQDLVAHYKNSPYAVSKYARLAGHRLPAIEPIILKSDVAIVAYARRSVKGRWPEGEAELLSGANEELQLVDYAIYVIKGRWKEAEGYISRSPGAALKYAKDVLRGRFPEAEANIKNSWAADDYDKFANALKDD